VGAPIDGEASQGRDGNRISGEAPLLGRGLRRDRERAAPQREVNANAVVARADRDEGASGVLLVVLAGVLPEEVVQGLSAAVEVGASVRPVDPDDPQDASSGSTAAVAPHGGHERRRRLLPIQDPQERFAVAIAQDRHLVLGRDLSSLLDDVRLDDVRDR
jgi:hypothetical protein